MKGVGDSRKTLASKSGRGLGREYKAHLRSSQRSPGRGWGGSNGVWGEGKTEKIPQRTGIRCAAAGKKGDWEADRWPWARKGRVWGGER